MIRALLYLLFTNLLLFILINVLYPTESSLYIYFEEYKIETDIITLAFLLCLFVFSILILFNVILNTIIWTKDFRKYIKNEQLKTTYKIIINLLVATIANNNKPKITPNINKNIQNIDESLYNFIYLQLQNDEDSELYYLKKLLNSKDLKYFAIKNISKIYYKQHLYTKSLKYALMGFNINDMDQELIYIIISCYGNLGDLENMFGFAARLEKVDSNIYSEIRADIANYYLVAAKKSWNMKESKSAIHYLESSLCYDPLNINSLYLYCQINLINNCEYKNRKWLIAAFSSFPSLEIAELYIESSRESPETIYDELASGIDDNKHCGLLLAIAAYLNLQNKITEMRDKLAAQSSKICN